MGESLEELGSYVVHLDMAQKNGVAREKAEVPCEELCGKGPDMSDVPFYSLHFLKRIRIAVNAAWKEELPRKRHMEANKGIKEGRQVYLTPGHVRFSTQLSTFGPHFTACLQDDDEKTYRNTGFPRETHRKTATSGHIGKPFSRSHLYRGGGRERLKQETYLHDSRMHKQRSQRRNRVTRLAACLHSNNR